MFKTSYNKHQNKALKISFLKSKLKQNILYINAIYRGQENVGPLKSVKPSKTNRFWQFKRSGLKISQTSRFSLACGLTHLLSCLDKTNCKKYACINFIKFSGCRLNFYGPIKKVL